MNPDQRRLVLEQTKQKLADTRQKRQQQEEERKWNLAMILDKILWLKSKTMTSEELAKLLKDVDADKPEKQNANITYSKATQTEEESCESAVDSLTYQDTQVSKREVGGQKESEDCVKQEQPPAIDSEVVSSIEAKTVEPADLDFNQFFCQSTRIIERALEDDKDIFVDYTTADRHVHEIQSMCKELLSFNAEFSMDQFTSNRYVRSLDYSSFYPELLVVAYDRNPYNLLRLEESSKCGTLFSKRLLSLLCTARLVLPACSVINFSQI
uniref:Uncharacterized protein n=1 Tax=Ditylenchus dipsaci TaxID=166011 RepID=A0A915DRE6_9BILA